MKSIPNNKAVGSALFTFISGIVIFVAVIFFLVKLATTGYYSDVDETVPSAVQTRLQPVGAVNVGDGVPVGQRQGKAIFEKICIQCHATDSTVPNVPRITHKDEWAPRIAEGLPTLLNHAIHGFKGMPARGGASDLTDDEVARAIVYMTNQSGANFTEPAANSAAAGSDASATSGSSAPATAGSDSSANSAGSAPAAATKVAAKVDGKAVFDSVCIVCHNANSAIPNVPRITHKDEWAPRIAEGLPTLLNHAIHGFKGMPARGGNPNLSDDEVKAAIVYMANQSGGAF